MHSVGRWLVRAAAPIIVLGFFLPSMAVSCTVPPSLGQFGPYVPISLGGLAARQFALWLVPLGALAAGALTFLAFLNRDRILILLLSQLAGLAVGLLAVVLVLLSVLGEAMKLPTVNVSPAMGMFVLTFGYGLAAAGIVMQFLEFSRPLPSRNAEVSPAGAGRPVAAVPPIGARLEILHGTRAGSVIALTPDHTVGRGPQNHLQLLDPTVSRTHARFRRSDGAWFVQDLGSRTGILVNQNRVPAARLKPGDRITIGNTVFIFRL